MPETRSYTSAELNRMQQEAMARMMEMRQEPASGSGWSTNPNMPRQDRAPRQQPPAPPAAPPRQGPGGSNGQPQAQPQNRRRPGETSRSRSPGRGPANHRPSPPPPPREEKKGDTTLLQDILGAVGLDDDRVLILGLILILVNAKADTTLILALCYLLL